MELDSPSITPPDSPAFSPTAVPDLIAKLSILPPSPTSSIASSSGAQDMQVSPIDTGSSPNLLDDIPYLPLDPHPVSPTGKALDPRAAFPYPLAIPKSPSPELSVTSNLAFLHAIDIIDKAIARHDAALPDSRREGISDIPNGPENAARNPNSPARPVKSNVHNPFVSAGFMTDFVAASDKPAPPPDAKTAPFTNTDITVRCSFLHCHIGAELLPCRSYQTHRRRRNLSHHQHHLDLQPQCITEIVNLILHIHTHTHNQQLLQLLGSHPPRMLWHQAASLCSIACQRVRLRSLAPWIL